MFILYCNSEYNSKHLAFNKYKVMELNNHKWFKFKNYHCHKLSYIKHFCWPIHVHVYSFIFSAERWDIFMKTDLVKVVMAMLQQNQLQQGLIILSRHEVYGKAFFNLFCMFLQIYFFSKWIGKYWFACNSFLKILFSEIYCHKYDKWILPDL